MGSQREWTDQQGRSLEDDRPDAMDPNAHARYEARPKPGIHRRVEALRGGTAENLAGCAGVAFRGHHWFTGAVCGDILQVLGGDGCNGPGRPKGGRVGGLPTPDEDHSGHRSGEQVGDPTDTAGTELPAGRGDPGRPGALETEDHTRPGTEAEDACARHEVDL